MDNPVVVPHEPSQPAGPPHESAGEPDEAETLEQYAERVVAATRKKMLDRLDDDVIGAIKDSHLVFGKACAMEAVTTAMNEMADKISETRGDPRATPDLQAENARLRGAIKHAVALMEMDCDASACAHLREALSITKGEG